MLDFILACFKFSIYLGLSVVILISAAHIVEFIVGVTSKTLLMVIDILAKIFN